MKTKHTKGNWILDKIEPQVFIGKLFNSGTDAEFKAYVQHSTDKYDEARANAKLIAAAPELLEACKLAQSYIDYNIEFGCGGGGEGKYASVIDKAIKKATE